MAEVRTHIPIKATSIVWGDHEKVVHLYSPSRKLIVTVKPSDEGVLEGSNILSSDPKKVHMRGETRALYAKARRVLQTIANEDKKPVRVLMGTKNQKMIDFFTKGAGKRLFPWDTPDVDEPGKLHLTATLNPR